MPREPQELPRESQELSPAVRGQAQESTSADEEEEGATGLLTLCNSDWQQQQPQQQPDQAEQGHHSQQAEQQVLVQENYDADLLDQQKQLFQAQLDAQDVYRVYLGLNPRRVRKMQQTRESAWHRRQQYCRR